MRGIADEAYAAGMQDCMKEVCARAYIARSKQIGAKRKRSKAQGEQQKRTARAPSNSKNGPSNSERV